MDPNVYAHMKPIVDPIVNELFIKSLRQLCIQLPSDTNWCTDKMQMKKYRSHAEVKMKVDTRKEDDHGDDIEHQTRGKSSSVLYMETVGTALSAQVHSNGARDTSIDVDESSIQDL